MNVVPLRGSASRAAPPAGSELRRALASCRHAFLGVGLMSGMINLLYLTGSFFMLEIYDRVLPSRSVPTLIGLAVIAAVLFSSRACSTCSAGACSPASGPRSTRRSRARLRRDRAPAAEDSGVGRRAAAAARPRPGAALPLGPRAGRALRPALDAALYRHLLPLPFLDRSDGARGALLLVALTLVAEVRTRQPTKAAAEQRGSAQCARPGEPAQRRGLQAMGMGGRLGARWSRPTRTSWTRSSAPPTWPAGLAPSPRCCAWRCNRPCSASAPIWSSSRRRPPGSSSPARS